MNQKLFLFVQENNYYLNDNIFEFYSNPTANGSYYNTGEYHRSKEIHPDT